MSDQEPAEVMQGNVEALIGTRDLVRQLIKERDQARELLDALWAELPADVVLTLAADLVEACRDNHERVWHGAKG